MLARDVVRYSEQRWGIDWAIMHGRLAQDMSFLPWEDAGLGDPLRYPTYWCLPALLGGYVDASRTSVLVDTLLYARACLIRHFAFEHARELRVSRVADTYDLFAAAYESNFLDGGDRTLEERLTAKCSPWLLAISLGTRRLASASSGNARLEVALNAVRTTFAAVQMIDDWNDRIEDRERSLWNLWNERKDGLVAVHLTPLLDVAANLVDRLKPHPLTRALAAQVTDTRLELARIAALTASAEGAERGREPD